MNKKVIVLADNSYTIRRIVELSFSEIENIEVRSFENGSGIKEKLLQLNPAVVMVDIKLPEINGYDVCRFINETPRLNQARVFLMKGSFEPVDNEMIKNLKYEDIITKPFDSNALVTSVMKIVNREERKIPDESPSTFPEDFPEIETEAPETEDISFSDIRNVIDVAPAPGRAAAGNQGPERDEVLPSEEITQGTQPLKDSLMPQETEESLKNPFEEEPAFEEINEAPVKVPRSEPIEFAKEPMSPTPPAGSQPKDASDEFHERFLEIANEDTSEDLLKSSLEASQMPDSDDLQFPGDMKEETPLAVEEKFQLEFDKTDGNVSAETMYVGPEKKADFMAANLKREKGKGIDMPEDRVSAKGPAGEKAHAEVLSPQAELEKLARIPKKEIKAEPQVKPVAPLAEKLDLSGKLEEKLSLTIKELLWEIVPPLAEKIIKEEIEKIKSDVNNTGL
jgi:CheY-like chemotaxis protein